MTGHQRVCESRPYRDAGRCGALALFMVACLSASCDPSQPLDLGEADSFALETADGRPVPSTHTLADSRVVAVLADTIRIHATGQWTRIQLFGISGVDGKVDLQSHRSEGSVRADGDLLVLNFECLDEPSVHASASASCVAPERVLITGDRLVIQRSTYLYGFRLVYRRID